jgi:signal transduction histidine kinase
MEQLLHNMISNALKFSKRDVRPTIDISASKATKGLLKSLGLNGKGEYVVLKFADNGIGLALCRKIVSNHNGRIIAEGKENEGATFKIILPVKQAEITINLTSLFKVVLCSSTPRPKSFFNSLTIYSALVTFATE